MYLHSRSLQSICTFKSTFKFIASNRYSETSACIFSTSTASRISKCFVRQPFKRLLRATCVKQIRTCERRHSERAGRLARTEAKYTSSLLEPVCLNQSQNRRMIRIDSRATFLFPVAPSTSV